jgi:hypothetical protein
MGVLSIEEHLFMAKRDGQEPNGPPQTIPAPAPAPAPARSIEDQLDEALADSFPASDPVSFVTSQTEEAWATDPKAEPDRKPGS